MIEDKKKWYKCPHCNKKIALYYDKRAISKKVYIKCRGCKKEIEIKID